MSNIFADRSAKDFQEVDSPKVQEAISFLNAFIGRKEQPLDPMKNVGEVQKLDQHIKYQIGQCGYTIRGMIDPSKPLSVEMLEKIETVKIGFLKKDIEIPETLGEQILMILVVETINYLRKELKISR